MQPTTAQQGSLLQDPAALKYSAGLELIDKNLNVLEDITDDFYGGVVNRASYATLHGTATFYISRELNWGNAIVRPYMNVSDFMTSSRFNLGAYLASSPRMEVAESPITRDVDAYDVLHWVNNPAGEAYTVAAGTGYLAAAEQVLVSNGWTAYVIDQTAADKTLDSSRTWVFSDNVTWLNIINDLLASIGYQGLWSDWDGRLRMQPYQVPTDRAPEWYYDIGLYTSMLAPERARIEDTFAAPNRWVFFWNKDPAASAPVEGNGIYTFTNNNIGPTSVEARGRVISAAPEQIDVADQDSLVNAAQARIDADMRLKTTFEVKSHPNPAHWHFDRLAVNDPALGPLMDVLVTKWSLPLNGDWMTQEWSLL